jgi:hypothetical protein
MASLVRRLACAALLAGACTHPEALVPADPASLRVSSGALVPRAGNRFLVEHPSFRAETVGPPPSAAEIAFVYRQPTAHDAPLASGELRRQIGLKLRARDACNVVYVMWHVAPSPGLEVSVKSNPGLTTHEECGDRGYTFVKPAWSREPEPVREGEARVLGAALQGSTLRVTADGVPAWEGTLPAQAFAFDGPAGVRSDNGVFDVELRVSPPARREPASPQ